MSRLPIVTYLNDHLSGSEMALEILDDLGKDHDGSSLGTFFAALQEGIETDRRELEQLMRELGINESGARKATAWLAEKLTSLKLRLEDRDGGDLRLLESLELLSLGIEGKRMLWLALSAAAERAPSLRQLDYDRLIRRAEVQRDQVEEQRLGVAARILGSGSGGEERDDTEGSAAAGAPAGTA